MLAALSGKVLRRLPLMSIKASSPVAFFADSGRLIAIDKNGRPRLHSLGGSGPGKALAGKDARSVAVGPKGRCYAISSLAAKNGQIHLRGRAPGHQDRVIPTIATSRDPTECALRWSGDSKRLAIHTELATVVVDPHTGATLYKKRYPEAEAPSNVALSQEGDVMATGTQDEEADTFVTLIRIKDGAIITQIGKMCAGGTLRFVDSGRALVSVNEGKVCVYRRRQ